MKENYIWVATTIPVPGITVNSNCFSNCFNCFILFSFILSYPIILSINLNHNVIKSISLVSDFRAEILAGFIHVLYCTGFIHVFIHLFMYCRGEKSHTW